MKEQGGLEGVHKPPLQPRILYTFDFFEHNIQPAIREAIDVPHSNEILIYPRRPFVCGRVAFVTSSLMSYFPYRPSTNSSKAQDSLLNTESRY
jgi:hypothetical protein